MSILNKIKDRGALNVSTFSVPSPIDVCENQKAGIVLRLATRPICFSWLSNCLSPIYSLA